MLDKKLIENINLSLYNFDFQIYCHICGQLTDPEWICERCGEHYCERCSAPYNIHTQIDYNCCSSCYENYIDNCRE